MADLMNPEDFLKQTEGLMPQTPVAAQPGPALLSPEDFLKQTEFAEFQGVLPGAAALGAGIARGVTFGLSDVAARAVGLNERLAKLKKFRPGLSLTGEVFGAVAPSLVTGGAGALATAARVAATPTRLVSAAGQIAEGALAKQFVSEASKSAARKVVESAAAKGLGSAVEGLAYGAGQVVSEAALGDPKQVAENAVATLGLSSILGGALGAGGKLIAPIAKGTIDSISSTFKDWPQRLIGLDEQTIKTINAKPDKIQDFIARSDIPDDAVLSKATELAQDLQAKRNSTIQALANQADESVAPIQAKAIKLGEIVDSLEQAKKTISPDDIRLDPKIGASLKQLDDVIDTSFEIAKKNAGIPEGEEAARLIKEVSDFVFDDFEKKREAFLQPRWAKMAETVEKLKVDPQALPLKPYLNIIDETAKRLGIDEIAIGPGGKQIAQEIAQLKSDLIQQAIANLGIVKPRGLSQKEIQAVLKGTKLPLSQLYLKGSQLVGIKKAFDMEASFAKELGKTTPMETMYGQLYSVARKQLEDLAPNVIGPINAELKKSIEAQDFLKSFGLKKRGGDVEIRKEQFSKLFKNIDKLSPSVKQKIDEIDKLFGTQIAQNQQFVSQQFDIKKIPKERLLVDAGQLEQIRNQLATKIAGVSPDSRLYKGLVAAHELVVKSLKDAGAKNIDQIANKQIELYKSLNNLSRYGLDSDIIDPTKVKDLLLTSVRRGEKDFVDTKRISEELGIDLIEAREVAKAYYNMTQKIPLQRLGTGASTLIPGGLAVLGSMAGPVAAAGGFVAGTALQNQKNLPKIINAISTSQKQVGKIADKLAKFGGSAASYIPPNTIPFLTGKIAALTTLEKQNQKVDRQIQSAINGFINPQDVDQMPTSFDSLKQTSFTKPYAKSLDDRIEAFNVRLGEIVDAASDLNSLNERIIRNTQAVNLIAPQVAAELLAKGVEASQFLLSKAPKNPIMDELQPQKTDWRPSDAELAKFERYVEAVENPLQIFKDLKARIITNEQVETIKTLYPTIYSKLVLGIKEKVSTRKQPLTYAQRNQLSVLFQQPLTQLHRPQVLAYLQGQMPQEQQPQGAPSFSARSQKLALSNLTETQRIERGV